MCRAVAFCEGRNPAKVFFVHDKMREHFCECCLNGDIKPFPELMKGKVAMTFEISDL